MFEKKLKAAKDPRMMQLLDASGGWRRYNNDPTGE
jgi:hypothetical protein